MLVATVLPARSTATGTLLTEAALLITAVETVFFTVFRGRPVKRR